MSTLRPGGDASVAFASGELIEFIEVELMFISSYPTLAKLVPVWVA
jgi:hypothetical protein